MTDSGRGLEGLVEEMEAIRIRAREAFRLYGEQPMPARAVTGEEYATDVNFLCDALSASRERERGLKQALDGEVEDYLKGEDLDDDPVSLGRKNALLIKAIEYGREERAADLSRERELRDAVLDAGLDAVDMGIHYRVDVQKYEKMRGIALQSFYADRPDDKGDGR